MKKIFILTVVTILASFIISGQVFAAQKTLTVHLWDESLGVRITPGSGCGGDPEPDNPGYYVAYAAGGNLSLPSNAKINGSIYAKTVVVSPNVTISGDIVAETVTIQSGVQVGGSICASAGNVLVNPTGVVVEGEIHAAGSITLGSGTTVRDMIYAGSDITLLASGSTAQKSVHSGANVFLESSCRVLQNVFSAGSLSMFNSNSRVSRDVHTGKDVNLQNHTYIDGNVWAGGSITNYPSNIAGARLTSQSAPPRILPTPPKACPNVPKPKLQSFTSGATDFLVPQSTTRTIEPGKYRDLDFRGGAILVMKAGTCSKLGDPGCYYFRKFDGGKWGQTLRLDFSTGNQITVFCTDEIRHSGPVEVSTNGTTWTRIDELSEDAKQTLARKTNWETHGSFVITTDNSTRQWFGTVLSKNNIALPSNAYIIGAYATVNGSVTADANIVITYVLADFARDHW